ncbi:MAG TPA: lipoprotein insertase outer membrane protein LolB [Dokdonella sp.]|uniref:lipoprotein insertase outer membrane protein LolB n=1 Tax=Dokdonella sp. TaxID=2291710 RepID=UPI0025C1281A|nr:lipoprotein insertase outer membrane protein LolB [Dokdonella sp.]MBX3691972.1 lipoprotein insertase outer membrane protein LolB [Dokdonella sp.]MCW5569057.1 lipoprotein insertase outer membrane protein LolB [Dokdonella sp.]HNR91979.1 lipoprotein insertase outer membrane protein LolB [Dokdonella sp.]
MKYFVPLRLLACALGLAWLAGCASQRIRPDAGLMEAQAQRERSLAAQPAWALKGRLAVATPQDGGSGSLEWWQDRDHYRFTVNAPVTGKTWTLEGDATRAELTGLRAGPVLGGNAAALLERELGWKVPVAQLASWVRAARAGTQGELVFRADGLPASLLEDGWKIDYPDYFDGTTPALPRRVFASRGGYRVRLVIERWQTP